jgi:D-alanine-D-alanine ligase-like ATP-grasp enzyme
VYRGTIVDGKLLGVLRGDPPRITGDGVSTIEQLIEKKNKNRHHEVKEFKLTPLTLDFLARSGYTPHSVLEKNKTIDLTEKIGTSYGGYRAEEIHICHPKTKEILEAVGRVVNFPVMGFDFIIQDITKDPDTQKWGILECNSLPFIDLHHHPLEGPAINIAQHLWNWWE